MPTFNEEHLVDVIWNTWEEFDGHFEPLSSGDFSIHMVTFDNSWSWNCAQVDVELKWYFSNVFDIEFFGWGLIVWNLLIKEYLSLFKLLRDSIRQNIDSFIS